MYIVFFIVKFGFSARRSLTLILLPICFTTIIYVLPLCSIPSAKEQDNEKGSNEKRVKLQSDTSIVLFIIILASFGLLRGRIASFNISHWDLCLRSSVLVLWE